MSQFNDETVTAFATRLSGHANLCDMLVTCDACEIDISFKNKLVMFQFVKGLKDSHAQERILEASASEEGRLPPNSVYSRHRHRHRRRHT